MCGEKELVHLQKLHIISGITDARVEGESEQTNHLLDDNSILQGTSIDVTQRLNSTTIQYLQRQVYIDSHAKKGGENNGEEWKVG